MLVCRREPVLAKPWKLIRLALFISFFGSFSASAVTGYPPESESKPRLKNERMPFEQQQSKNW